MSALEDLSVECLLRGLVLRVWPPSSGEGGSVATERWIVYAYPVGMAPEDHVTWAAHATAEGAAGEALSLLPELKRLAP